MRFLMALTLVLAGAAFVMPANAQDTPISKVFKTVKSMGLDGDGSAANAGQNEASQNSDGAENAEEEITSEGQIVECGVPLEFEDKNVFVAKDPKYDFCDIYTRQLAYRKEAMVFSDRLHERRKYFHAPGREALKNYKDAMKALNEERGESSE